MEKVLGPFSMTLGFSIKCTAICPMLFILFMSISINLIGKCIMFSEGKSYVYFSVKNM